MSVNKNISILVASRSILELPFRYVHMYEATFKGAPWEAPLEMFVKRPREFHEAPFRGASPGSFYRDTS